MSLNAKQAEFMATLGEFLHWCNRNGHQVIGGELYRTPEQAKIYARDGKGVKNSNHTKKLAIDLFVYKDGTVSWDKEDYEPLGDKWKSLHELARWGGDFPFP